MGFVITGRPATVGTPLIASAPVRQVTVCKKFKVVKVRPVPCQPRAQKLAAAWPRFLVCARLHEARTIAGLYQTVIGIW